MESAFPSSLKSLKNGNCRKKNNVVKRLRESNVCYAKRRISCKKIRTQVTFNKTVAGIMPNLSTERSEWAQCRFSIRTEWTSTRCLTTLSRETNLTQLVSHSRTNLTQTKPSQLLYSPRDKTATCLRSTVVTQQSSLSHPDAERLITWLIDRLWCDRIRLV